MASSNNTKRLSRGDIVDSADQIRIGANNGIGPRPCAGTLVPRGDEKNGFHAHGLGTSNILGIPVPDVEHFGEFDTELSCGAPKTIRMRL